MILGIIKRSGSVLILLSGILLFSAPSVLRENEEKTNTPGLATLTFRTVQAGGNYAPRHVLAIWIEDANGNFVKTNKLRANSKKQYLYTWNSKSNGNTVDAITGATLNSHTTHSVTWNSTDINGNIVPDGDYSFVLEFTDKHAQGPVTSVTFAKGLNPVSITKPDETYFKDISLSYGNNISIDEITSEIVAIKAYPNPFNDNILINVRSSYQDPVKVRISDISGKHIISFYSKPNTSGTARITWDGTNKNNTKVKEGVYIISAIIENQNFLKKIIYTK